MTTRSSGRTAGRMIAGRMAMLLLAGVTTAMGVAGCRKVADDETAQVGAAVGELLSGIDDASQDGTTTAMLPIRRAPDELRAPLWRRALDLALPSAFAGGCVDAHFSGCDAGTRTRSFTSCSVGVATIDGSTSLAYSSAPLCTLAGADLSVTRMASLTVTGLYGGSLSITSPGGGQTLTRTPTGFEYSVGGMERVLKGAGGRTVADISTMTTAPLEITGSSRADLTIVSGALKITHNLGGYSVTLVPNNLAWSAHCTCAVSGSLTGTVSGGKHDGKSASITLQGCGEAEITIAGETDAVSFDRCSTI